MSNKNNIKEKLFNYEVEVDNDALWSSLEQHVPKKENKGRFLIWFFSGLLILALSGWGLTSMLSSTTEEIVANSNDQSTNLQVEEGKTTLDINNDVETNHISSNNNETNKSIITDQILPKQVQSKQLNFKTTRSNTPAYTKTPTKTTIQESKNNLEYPQKPVLKELETTTQVNENMTIKNQITVTTIPMIHAMIKYSDQYDIPSFIQPVKQPEVKSWWVKPALGIGRSTVSHSIIGESSKYQQQLDNSFGTLPYFTTSINAGYNITDRLSIFSGINYSRYVSKLKIINNETIQNQSPGTVSTIIDENGYVTTSEGQLTTTTYQDYQAKWYTYHNFIDLPIGLNFNFYECQKFSLGINIAAQINIVNTHVGAILKQDNTLDKYTNKNQPYMVNLVTPLAGIQGRYLLTDIMSLGINFEIKSQKYQYQIGSNNVNEKHLNSGIQLFYQYQF